jgi:hypothetical protein
MTEPVAILVTVNPLTGATQQTVFQGMVNPMDAAQVAYRALRGDLGPEMVSGILANEQARQIGRESFMQRMDRG